jgi:lycopene beta-cyclase
MGGVPLEELGFFILQGLLVGLWLLWLAARIRTPSPSTETTGALRLLGAGLGTLIWGISLTVLLSGRRPGTYLGWELAWALPPLILQLVFGADILWRYRVLICSTLFPAVLYLSMVDAIALHDGIWTIDPHQSLGVRIGGLLPLEEFLFFALASTLVTFGLVLGVAVESRSRLLAIRRSASHHQATV